MAEVNMPRLSDTMEEGTITRWLKKPGDQVQKGEVVAEVETDKANMEIESYTTGILEQILVQEGQSAPIGQPIAIVGDGSTTHAPQTQAVAPQNTSLAQNRQPQAANNHHDVAASISAPAPVESGLTQLTGARSQFKVSPLARRMAEEHNINLSELHGTGPGGRIVRDDIEDYLEQHETSHQPSTSSQESPTPTPQTAVETIAPMAAAHTASEDEITTLSTMQKTIARRLTESKQTIPHFYIGSEIDMTDILEMRKKLNANVGNDGIKISVNDLIVKACALALEKFPEVNGSYKDGQFILHKHINVGIAVDIPHGLIVPVVREANIKGLRSIARETKALAAKAQTGKITPADLEDGTFSISNLGMMDVTDFVAVINPPQAAILAVAATKKTFVPIDDQPVVRDIMHVTISADHRILYGATVARFLQELKRLLQDPYSLLG